MGAGYGEEIVKKAPYNQATFGLDADLRACLIISDVSA